MGSQTVRHDLATEHQYLIGWQTFSVLCLCTRHYCITLSILGFCFWMQLSYSETVWSLLFTCLLSLKSIVFHCLVSSVLRTIVFIYFVQVFSCFRKQDYVNLAPVITSLLGIDISWFPFPPFFVFHFLFPHPFFRHFFPYPLFSYTYFFP